MGVHRRRAGRDGARPRAGRHARRTARPQPAGRLRAARRRRRDGGRGLPPRRRQPACGGRRAGQGGGAGPRYDGRGDPGALRAHRPHRARARWRSATPAYAAWCSPRPTPTRSPPGERALLREAGIDVEQGLMVDEARAVNRVWTFAVEHGRPFVTWKFATTLDGRSAAADGTSRWVSGRAARLDTHRLRALCDVMLVGTNTVDVDDPQLTVRDEHDQPLPPSPAAAGGHGRARPARRPSGSSTTQRRDPAPAHPRPRDRAEDAVRPGPPARLPRGRPDARRGVPAGRAGRRDRRLRRPDAARRRPAGRRRPRNHHHRRRVASRGHRRDRAGRARTDERAQRPPHHDLLQPGDH